MKNDWIIADENDKPEGLVLGIVLSVFDNSFSPKLDIVYFEEPLEEIFGDGNLFSDSKGWKCAKTHTKILVTHWMKLPEIHIEMDISQKDFIDKFSLIGNFGSVPKSSFKEK